MGILKQELQFRSKIGSAIATFSAISSIAYAELSLPSFFSDGMVLQRETGAKIWGSANAGQEVKVSFAGQDMTVKAGKDGKWVVELKGLSANKKGEALTITAGNESKKINDVLVGEVWLASGQSNMEWTVVMTDSRPAEAQATDDLLRVYVSSNVTSIDPASDFKGVWQSTKPTTVLNFTAVGYHFAKALRAELDVPVGIIECAWGGRTVQAFVSDEALQQCPEATVLLDQKNHAITQFSPEKAEENFAAAKKIYQAALEKWTETKQGRKPWPPQKQVHPSLDSRFPSTIYNGMIAPIVGYSVRGAIWYQGESNAVSPDHSATYGELLECLIHDWRQRWGSDLSFYYVQLANFKARSSESWVIVQDEMRLLLDDTDVKESNIGMATIHDIGHPTDIHPRNKKDVGLRLSRWALNKDYGMKDVVVSGPLYASHRINGSTIELTFDYGIGLKSRDGQPLGSFEIAGNDGVWKTAVAKVAADKVLVSSKEVAAPVKVRYAWHSDPQGANLVNAEGLPTSCFTTN